MALDPGIAARIAHLRDATLAQVLSGEVEGVPPAPSAHHAGVVTEDLTEPVRVRTYRPEGAVEPSAVLVWAHGGGWQYGDLDMPEADTVAQLVALAGITVVSVDYRLAPAHTHPAALDDVLAAYRWATTIADRVAVGGASAGGLLAAAAALVLPEAGERPSALWLAYPVTDPDGGPYEERHPDCPPVLWLGREGTVGLFSAYLGSDPASAGPPIVPARGRLELLPPTLVTTAECDSLRAQGAAFAEAARAAGADVTHHHVESVLHGYLNTVGDSPLADAALSRHVAWLQAVLDVGIETRN